MNAQTPLGIKPRWKHQEDRIQEICRAITERIRHAYDEHPKVWDIPVEWVEEYNELVEAFNKRKGEER
jgi:hypothetical protein